MEINEKIIYKQFEDAREKIAYLRDVNIGIPVSEIKDLEKKITETESLLKSNKNIRYST